MVGGSQGNRASCRIDHGHVQSRHGAVCPHVSPFNAGAGSAASFELMEAPVASESDVERAISAAAAQPAAGLIVLPDSFLVSRRELIVTATARHRLPAIYSVSEFTRSGGLVAYGVERTDLFRRAASYVDRILTGAKPADLPVQQPVKFELAVNLRTAKTLGLEVPPTLLARADE